MTRHAHAAHHIGLEEALPIGIGYLGERLRFEDAEIVHQDVGRAHPRDKGGDASCVGEIGCNALDLRLRYVFVQALRRAVDFFLAAAIDDDRRAPSARPRIIAKPIPDVDPVTAPRLPLRAIFMSP